MVRFGWFMDGTFGFLEVDLSGSSGISSFLLGGRRIIRNFVVEQSMVVTITRTTLMGGGTFGSEVISTETIIAQLAGTYGITAVLD